MIDRVKIQNYKSLKDVEMTFDSRLTVLVGANGSGKSSVLRCIEALCLLTNPQANVSQLCTTLYQWLGMTFSGQSEPQLLELTEHLGSSNLGVRYRAHPTMSFSYPEHDRETRPWDCVALLQTKELPLITLTNNEKEWKLSCWPVQVVMFDPRKLAQPTMTKSNPPQMSADGTGIASLMGYFKYYDEDRFNQAAQLFQKIVPKVIKVRVDRQIVDAGATLGEGLVFDLPNRKGVPASQMSDGTLYALGLIVKILDPQRPKTLLIDDIDHGFHPKAQTQLVELIKKLLEEFPDLQIIATSHSPYILSGLDWNEVRVLNLQDDGTTVIRPLTDHPKYEKWHDTMTPGEFWSHAGEEWVSEASAKEEEA